MSRLVLTALLLIFTGALAADPGLEAEPKSSKAKSLREEGKALCAPALPIADRAKAKQQLEPGELEKALADLEKGVQSYEKALQMEWNSEANRQLADALRAYFRLRPLRPAAAPPADEEMRKKYDKELARAERERLNDTRKFIMDLLGARKFEKCFVRCDRCDGRGDLFSPFGDKTPCPGCARAGMLPRSSGVLESRWLVYSPLYRANAGNFSQVDRILRTAQTTPKSLAPFLKTGGIDGRVEDHGDWVRVTTKEQVYQEPGARNFDKVKVTYTLFRVGSVWYLYTPRFDRDLIEIPDLPEEPADGE